MELQTIAAVSLISVLIALILTPVVRDGFLRMDLVDHPDGARKLHTRPIPRVGGIPIALAYVGAFAIYLAFSGFNPIDSTWMPKVLGLLPAAGAVFLTGLADDVYTLKPWQKLLGQVAGAALAMAAGVRVDTVAGMALDGWVSVPLTLTWLIFCTNSFNLIDGLDGLASGMGLFATLTIFLSSLLISDATLAMATLPLAAALVGFLRYNFNPASVFLGDSGSLLVGFLLGCYGVIWTQKSATLLGMTAPLMCLAVPLLDATLAIVRRWLRGQPIFGGDRNHIHHRLLAKGLGHRDVVLVLYAAGGLFATLSLLASFSGSHLGAVILVLFCAVTWAGVQSLGYAEFGAVSRILAGSSLRRVVHGQLAIEALKIQILAARSGEECWHALTAAGAEMGFPRIEAQLSGRHYLCQPEAADFSRYWQIRIPLPDGDWVDFGRPVGGAPQPTMVAALVDLVHSALAARLAEIEPVPAYRLHLAQTSAIAGLARAVGTNEFESEGDVIRQAAGD